MANPFGSADQTLSKNTGHTNQNSLIRALVPRSSSKWVEVISATAFTGLSNGTYDADGYFGGDGTRRTVSYTLPANLSPSGGYTIIVGVTHNSGGSTDGDCYVGIDDTIGLNANERLRFDQYNRRFYPYIVDSNATTVSINNTACSPGGDVFGAIIQSSTTAQMAYTRIGTTNYPDPVSSGSTSIGGSAVCNRFGLTYTSKFKFQYVFLYDSMLSETDINAIMADPGAVLTYDAGSSGVPKSTKFFLMGIG